MTMLDMLLQPELVAAGVGLLPRRADEGQKYQPLIAPDDKPAIGLNAKIMEQYRPEMRKYYYDPTKYKTYLEQLGITYPTTR